jgi:hypothetical protein
MSEKIYKLNVEVNEGNPVGEVHWIDNIEAKVMELHDKWLLEHPDMPWYKRVLTWSKPSLYQVTLFLMESLDELIQEVDDCIENGPDKKATVLAAIDKLYDHVGREAIPVLLRPFATKIKDYIVYTLVAASIDWIVNKYRHGEWRDKLDDIQEELNGEEKTE